MKLVFKSIKNESIFTDDFKSLTPANGTVEFKHLHTAGGMAVVYAPNGTGKSSLTRVLEAEKGSKDLSFLAEDEKGNMIAPETKSFHIIHDQIGRNVIPGKETDYLIGNQIRKEYELRDGINGAFQTAFDNLFKKFKTEFKTSKKDDFLLTEVGTLQDQQYKTAYTYLSSLINRSKHGKDIDQAEFIGYICDKNNYPNLIELDEQKRNFVITDCNGSKLVPLIISIDINSIIPNAETLQIEQDDDAITILQKYHDTHACIVCDNPEFDRERLLERKQASRKRIYESLDKKTKELLDKVVRNTELLSSDPFNIKAIVSSFISDGNPVDFIKLQEELKVYVHAIGDEMIDSMIHCFDGTSLLSDFDEYIRLTQTKPELDSEELLYIEDVINENIGKNITIERDPDSKNYKLKLGNQDLLGTSRDKLELSTGEQNFISLSFELLLARHSNKDYVVLDDPISSFDSVYKNKIAFCIVKFLEDKKQIVLTHNIDLIRLLNVQLNNCFNLYILNNTDGGYNGFLPVSDTEKNLLINMHELIKLFQNKNDVLKNSIRNRRKFLMAMVPFMRGYAHIILDKDDYFGKLSDIMHGYGTGRINIIPVYYKLFGYDFGGEEYISVNDVLNVDTDDSEILDKANFPLLNATLWQTLIYYHLRMKVEKSLVDAFHILPNSMDTLNQIIMKAFASNTNDGDYEKKRRFRVFFTSRKTLLNEFNHFEGNMNIFQPAIDITPTSLKKEVCDIETALKQVKEFAAGM